MTNYRDPFYTLHCTIILKWHCEKRIFLADPTPYFSPKFEEREYIIERQLRPEARGDIIEIMRNTGIHPTSMMDISDGLSSELHHICDNSQVGAVVYAERIPIDSETFAMAEELSIDPFTAALDGGEDYELLLCLLYQSSSEPIA